MGTAKGEAGLNREGNRVRSQKGVRWWRVCQSTGSPARGKIPIRFGIYNIRNGRNGGLELALRRVYQANINLGILQ